MGLSLVLFLLALVRTRKILFSDIFFGSTSFLLFFMLGVFTVNLHLPENQPEHFLNHSTEEDEVNLKLQVTEVLKPDLYNEKYVADVIQMEEKESHGRILLLKPKDSLAAPLHVGEQLLMISRTEIIPRPLNPHQFDYAKFMSNRGIERQVRLSSDSFIVLEGKNSGLMALAENVRRNIKENLEENNFDSEELAVVQALLLGQKQDISAEIYNNFAAAGVIHILAVSGLHVGIILIMLNRIFSPLQRLKQGRFLKTFLVIGCLWCFAFLAGLSPSVVRAVTMFSFIAIGMSIKRQTSTLNSVFISLLLLLLIRPQWIFEIGFQLSYSAVLAIILIRPPLYKLYRPEYFVPRYIWSLLSVTIAAQIGVLPLSLFYFHQFPGLFFISNLIILPALGFILMLGIAVIILASFSALPGFVTELYEDLIGILIKLVAKIAEQESFLFNDISFSKWEMIAFYLLIFSLLLALSSFSYQRIMLVLISIIAIQLVYINNKSHFSEELIVFHKSRATLIGQKSQNKLMILHKGTAFPGGLAPVKNYMIGEDLEELQEKTLKNAVAFKNKALLIVDSTGIYPPEPLQHHLLLLSNSPKVNLDRLLKDHQPKLIIADGSNYRSLVDKWKKTSAKSNIEFHSTSEEGALILK